MDIFDSLAWTPCVAILAHDGLPYVTHEAVLTIVDISLRVYQLSTGQRIIAAEDIEAFFEMP